MKRVVNGVIEVMLASDTTELPLGQGVFETLLWRDGQPVFFEEHWARFERGCRWCQFDLPTTSEKMRGFAAELARDNDVTTGILRFAAWDRREQIDWRVEVTPPRPHQAKPVFRVGVGPLLPAATPDRAFKHLDRGHWLQALHAARAAGWDEALLFDKQERLVESCVSNVFFVARDCLHTPSLEVGPLPGIMRSQVIQVSRTLGLTVKEGAYGPADLRQATEIWLSNSLIGLRPVAEWSGRPLAAATPVLDRLRAAWQAEHGWDPVVVTGQRS